MSLNDEVRAECQNCMSIREAPGFEDQAVEDS